MRFLRRLFPRWYERRYGWRINAQGHWSRRLYPFESKRHIRSSANKFWREKAVQGPQEYFDRDDLTWKPLPEFWQGEAAYVGDGLEAPEQPDDASVTSEQIRLAVEELED